MPARKAVSILMVAALGMQPALAADTPYFRFQLGKAGTESAEGLRFAAAAPLSDGQVGTPVSVAYAAAGGKAPYAMDLLDAPAGLRIEGVSATAWRVTGTLTPAGAYANAAVRLTDSAGTSVSYPVPVGVISPGTAQALPLAFASAEAVPSGKAGTPVRATYVAKGGKPPYEMRLKDTPANLAIARADETTWVVSGTLGPAGAYPGGLVALTDSSAGPGTTFALPLTVSPDGQAAPELAFANADALPNGRVGTRVRSYYQATGGKAPYSMSLVAAPPGVSLTSVSPDTWTAVGTLAQVGSYQSATVRLTDAANPTGVSFAVPVEVTDVDALAFTRTSAFPAKFPSSSLQSAEFAVEGGVPPYAWSLAAAPSTVVAASDPSGSANVAGSIDKAGVYGGVTVTVTDARGTKVSKTLPDFEVTDSGAAKLTVSGLAPLPATVKVGQQVVASGIRISGTSGNHYVGGSVLGAGTNGAGKIDSSSYGTDPVNVAARFSPTAADAGNTYDVSLEFHDYFKPENTVLVPWGKVTVTTDPLQVTKSFDPLYKGKAATTTEAFARVRGGSGSYSVSLGQPAGSNLNGYAVNCPRYPGYCSKYGLVDGEDVVGVEVKFATPGLATPFRAVVTDDVTGEKAFLDAFSVETEKLEPMTKISEFPPSIDVEGSAYGSASFSDLMAKVRNGSNLVQVDYSVTSTGGNAVNVFGAWRDCTDPSGYFCALGKAAAGENLIALDGNLPPEGSYEIAVTATDPGSESSVAFKPFTVNVSPPPLSQCQFKPIKGVQGLASTTADAIRFVGGQAPFKVEATGLTGVSFGPVRTLARAGRAVDAILAANASGSSMHVKVTDARNQTCEGDAGATFHAPSAGGPVPVVVERGDWGSSWFITESSVSPLLEVVYSADEFNGYAFGPFGVHPAAEGIMLGFAPTDGATVVGFTPATASTPLGNYSFVGPDQFGYGDPRYVYMQNMHLTGTGARLVPGDYKYSYYVFLADGSYRLSETVTIRLR